eukprot:5870561-Prorocentrum_lima.AAC.1
MASTCSEFRTSRYPVFLTGVLIRCGCTARWAQDGDLLLPPTNLVARRGPAGGNNRAHRNPIVAQ